MTKSILGSVTIKDIVVPLMAAAFGAAATIATAMTGYFNKDKELNIQMLNIALGILREDPKKSQIAAARGWAVDVINHSSPISISMEAREELIKNELKFGNNYNFGYDNTYYDTGGYEGPRTPQTKPKPKNR